jgi:phytoene synthase
VAACAPAAVKADALRGHVYLPLEDLRQFHVTEEEVVGLVFNEKFRKLMAHEADRARDYFAAARAVLPASSRRAARPALVMAGIYEGLLAKIREADFNVYSERIRLSLWEKLMRFARAWWETR